MRLLCFVKEAIVTKLGIIPIAQQFIDELGIVERIDAHIKGGDEEISHGKVINVLLLNMLDSPSPLYRVADWLGDYTDGLGEYFKEAHKFHDKRLGATLDALYESDRHSLLSELSGQTIAVHEICTDVVHNDTTSITFTGAYKRDQAVGSEIVITPGYNKDNRPDCKQIVFGLNVSADGYVPLLGQFYSGNKTDDQTHQVNWQALRELLCKEDFIYIADSKLCSTENLIFVALIERKMRKNMETQGITDLPILPQGMKTSKPTWSNIKFCFNSVIMLSVLIEGEHVWKHQVKGISKHQQSVLELLDVKQAKYQQMTPKWWLSTTDRGG